MTEIRTGGQRGHPLALSALARARVNADIPADRPPCPPGRRVAAAAHTPEQQEVATSSSLGATRRPAC